MSDLNPELRANLGTRRIVPLPAARFPDAGSIVSTQTSSTRPAGAVDVLLVNPPAPDGGIWIRSQHRVGRRSRENMIWPQVSLAQLAALLLPDYTVEIVDCIATRMGWPEFEALLEQKRPKYYLTQVTAPSLRNDMHGVFVAKALGAATLAFGTHVTPLTLETMRPFPSLDFILRGEPEMTLRELLDTFEARTPTDPAVIRMLQATCDPDAPVLQRLVQQAEATVAASDVSTTRAVPAPSPTKIRGLAWRDRGEIVINPDRSFIPSLDDLPIPRHDLLPLDKQRMPMIKGPFTFIVTSRGCPAGCKYCIKHVSYQNSVRVRSPQLILEELQQLAKLGIHHVHMYADLFTVNREQVVELCRLIIDSGLKVSWTCNSRVDYVDEEMLQPDGPGRLLVHLLGHRECERGDPQAGAQGLPQGAGAPGAEVGAQGGDQQLGLLHYRSAGRDRGDDPGDHRVREGVAARHLPLPHRRALPGHAVLLRGGGEQLVPARHEVGRGRHGSVHRAGLSRTSRPSAWSTGRSARPGSGRSAPDPCGPS